MVTVYRLSPSLQKCLQVYLDRKYCQTRFAIPTSLRWISAPLRHQLPKSSVALSPKHLKQAAQCALPSGNSNRAAILRLIGKATPKELMPPSIHLSMQVCMNELVIKFDAPEGQRNQTGNFDGSLSGIKTSYRQNESLTQPLEH